MIRQTRQLTMKDLKHVRQLRHFKALTAGILALLAGLPTCAISTEANISPKNGHIVTNDITRALELTPNLENGKEIYRMCGTCHMENGAGKLDGSFPVLTGQHRNVLIKQLEDIQNKNRDNPTMFPFSNPEEIGGLQGVSDVTAYIAQLKPVIAHGTGDGKDLATGKALFTQHCVQCHGDRAQGNNDAFFPKLQGQHYAYLLRQLRWIRDGYRKNGNAAMLAQIKTMSDAELSAIADYITRLKLE